MSPNCFLRLVDLKIIDLHLGPVCCGFVAGCMVPCGGACSRAGRSSAPPCRGWGEAGFARRMPLFRSFAQAPPSAWFLLVAEVCPEHELPQPVFPVVQVPPVQHSGEVTRHAFRLFLRYS